MARTGSSQSTGSQEEEGDVADDTLNMLYKKAQMYDPDMPSMDPPASFKFELRKYQKQALCWMVGKEEGGERDVRKQQSLNPLWEEYVFPREETPLEEEAGEMFYVNPYSGEMSLLLPTIESIQKGGILADGTKNWSFKLTW
jgi:DNA repair protein RAD5